MVPPDLNFSPPQTQEIIKEDVAGQNTDILPRQQFIQEYHTFCAFNINKQE